MTELSSGGRSRLIAYNLSIESDRDVPGAIPDPAPAGAPDVRIRTMPPIPASDPPPPLYRMDGDTLIFSAEKVGRYRCRCDEIAIAAEHRADPDMVSALLIATALPALLWLRGEAMVHAAGIVAPSGESALAIAGPSGIGKSVVTAQLLSTGGALLADDSICLKRHGSLIAGSGLPGGYHLRHHNGSRDFYALPCGRSTRAATIDAVAILVRTDGAPGLVRLNPLAALEKLLANLHRPAASAVLGRRAQTLATMAFIAANCAVYEWHRSSAALDVAEREMLAGAGLW